MTEREKIAMKGFANAMEKDAGGLSTIGKGIGQLFRKGKSKIKNFKDFAFKSRKESLKSADDLSFKSNASGSKPTFGKDPTSSGKRNLDDIISGKNKNTPGKGSTTSGKNKNTSGKGNPEKSIFDGSGETLKNLAIGGSTAAAGYGISELTD